MLQALLNFSNSICSVHAGSQYFRDVSRGHFSSGMSSVIYRQNRQKTSSPFLKSDLVQVSAGNGYRQFCVPGSFSVKNSDLLFPDSSNIRFGHNFIIFDFIRNFKGDLIVLNATGCKLKYCRQRGRSDMHDQILGLQHSLIWI